ncbi:MAG: ABC transporter substrate-binding protein [Lachnospiraceae bacterium]|nr:ABC transporter substrate-binding protein [Lachnospiraceae bacterium]
MKKRICAILAVTLAAAALAGCGSKASNEADKKIVVGASPSPHAEILNEAKALLEKQGYTLEIKEYNDYVQPNVALDAGDLDANYFQHQPYLDQFNEERKMELASAGMIHYEPFGIYAGKTASLDALSDGAQVAVPNDATNEARALLLLEAQGVITLKEGAGINATKLDVAENPKNIEIVEMEAAQLPRSLQDVDIAVINGNYAIGAGLKVADALAIEDADSIGATTYGNIVAVQKGHKNDEKIKALVDVLKGDEIKKFIEEKYEGAVVPLS